MLHVGLQILASQNAWGAAREQRCGIDHIAVSNQSLDSVLSRDSIPNFSILKCDRTDSKARLTLTTKYIEERVRRSLQRGVQCLSQFESQRGNVQKLLSLFASRNPRVSLICAETGEVVGRYSNGRDLVVPYSTAMSLPCGATSSPLLVLNSETMLGFKDSAVESVTFHELLHLMGSEHKRGIDLSDLAEACCFEANSPSINRRACEALRTSPEWTSTGYLELAARIANENAGTAQMIETLVNVLSKAARTESTIERDKIIESLLSAMAVLQTGPAAEVRKSFASMWLVSRAAVLQHSKPTKLQESVEASFRTFANHLSISNLKTLASAAETLAPLLDDLVHGRSETIRANLLELASTIGGICGATPNLYFGFALVPGVELNSDMTREIDLGASPSGPTSGVKRRASVFEAIDWNFPCRPVRQSENDSLKQPVQ